MRMCRCMSCTVGNLRLAASSPCKHISHYLLERQTNKIDKLITIQCAINLVDGKLTSGMERLVH